MPVVGFFFRYPPKYSLSYIAKKIKGVLSKRLRGEFPHLNLEIGIFSNYVTEDSIFECERLIFHHT